VAIRSLWYFTVTRVSFLGLGRAKKPLNTRFQLFWEYYYLRNSINKHIHKRRKLTGGYRWYRRSPVIVSLRIVWVIIWNINLKIIWTTHVFPWLIWRQPWELQSGLFFVIYVRGLTTLALCMTSNKSMQPSKTPELISGYMFAKQKLLPLLDFITEQNPFYGCSMLESYQYCFHMVTTYRW
jgi:hypothetical protein